MRLVFLAATVLVATVCSQALYAAAVYVDDDAPNDPGPGDTSVGDPLENGSAEHPFDAIQEGINAAVGGDTVLVKDGTYTGEGNRDLDFGGKAITLRSEGGADTCIIDCEGSGRGLYFHSGETAASIVDGFTTTNGAVGGTSHEDKGGGIYCEGSSPTIRNCRLIANVVQWCGGGIGCNNSAPVIVACTFEANVARYGGAIDCDSSPAVIVDCSLSGNVAETSGGGMNFYGTPGPEITNCRITGNRAHGAGGGFYSYDSSATLVNCVIADNEADYYGGGGIWSTLSSVTLTNCTITGNRASSGGGICWDNSSSAATNCILWANAAPSGHEITLAGGSTLTVRYCDVQGGAAEAGIGVGCALDLDGTNIEADPLLRVEGHLTSGSPCIDVCPTGPAEDADGEARPFPAAGDYDIGADEFVDSDGDGLPDWWELEHFGSATSAEPDTDEEPDGLANLEEYERGADPVDADTDDDGRDDGQEIADDTNPLHADNAERTYYVNGDPLVGDDAYDGLAAAFDGVHGPKRTIQAGIDAATSGWNYMVSVAPWTYTGAGNRGLDFAHGLVVGSREIVLRSQAGAAATVIDCEGLGRGVDLHSRETAASMVDGFTITNGYAYNSGGGIYCYRSSPTIANCTITDSQADYNGGGIFCDDAVMSNCTITGNSADLGGGIFCGGNATITDCTVTGNVANDGGGGIHCSGGSPTITGCTISGNSASSGGGGIDCHHGDPTITTCQISDNSAGSGGGIHSTDHSDPTISGCTISGNSADSEGGGIWCGNGSPTIVGCTISGNSAEDGGGVFCNSNSPAISGCTISGNSAGGGGGIYCSWNAKPTLTNCAISGNMAVGGGGICCWHSSPKIANCTLSGNSAASGGGIRCISTGDPVVTNCILWGNTAVKGHEIALTYASSPSTLVARYSDVQGGAGAAYVESGCTLNLDGTNIDADPLLTADGHLRATAPCIDRCPTGPADDRDGEARPVDVAGVGNEGANTYDMGADEFVDTDADGLPDWWELEHFGSTTGADPAGDEEPDGLANLEEYKRDTDPLDADTDDDGRTDGQEVADGTNLRHPDNAERTYYVNGDPLVGDNAYDGLAAAYDGVHGPKRTIQAGIDCALAGWSYTVLVAEGTYAGAGNKDLDFGGKAITLRSASGAGTCIIDCEGSGRGFYFHLGETAASVLDGFVVTNGGTQNGSIHCSSSSNPLITNCTITGSASPGIYCSGSSPTISSSVISDNSSHGIYCSSGSPTITNCTISGNQSLSDGGGIWSSGGSPTITNCTISGNQCLSNGGGIKSSGGSPTITNCTITGNSSRSGGGVACGPSGNVTIANSILWGNSATNGNEIALLYASSHKAVTLTVRYSDIQGGASQAYVESGCTLDLDGTNIDADPLLTADGHLGPTSPCIDRCPTGPADDLDSEARPVDIAGVGNDGTATYDMGAYEFQVPTGWSIEALGDFDGDGKVDLLCRSAEAGWLDIWFMNGIERRERTAWGPPNPDASWLIQGTGEFDGDGKADIVWHNAATGHVAVWLMNGTRLRQGAVVCQPAATWQIAGTGDFDGDGRDDILWRNTATGGVAVWLMDGLRFRAAGAVRVVDPASGWSVAGTGDFDGDGRDDVLWVRPATGETAVWLMNGLRLRAAGLVRIVDPAAGWSIVGTGDFDGDGRDDVLWHSSTTNRNAVWFMNGLGFQRAGLIANVADANWTVAGCGDTNSDGRADIVWCNSETSDVAVWLMNGVAVTGAGICGNLP